MEAMGGESLPPDLSAPTVVHRVRAKFGYSEVHVPAPGFADHVSQLLRILNMAFTPLF